MLSKLVRLIFGSRNDRLVKKKKKLVKRINALSPEYEKLSDEALKAKTQEFRNRLNKGEKLDSLIPEAFAAVREASSRVFGMRHFDVQFIGGMILNDGKIAEMKTGEGKTLMATLAAYLNALPGNGVHVVTVNDYLAKRDSEWMGRLYSFLGLTTGVIISQMEHQDRQVSYTADITYGTNNEFGFDYLRDNMAFNLEQKVQRGLNFAIVDEDASEAPVTYGSPDGRPHNRFNPVEERGIGVVTHEGRSVAVRNLATTTVELAGTFAAEPRNAEVSCELGKPSFDLTGHVAFSGVEQRLHGEADHRPANVEDTCARSGLQPP